MTATTRATATKAAVWDTPANAELGLLLGEMEGLAARLRDLAADPDARRLERALYDLPDLRARLVGLAAALEDSADLIGSSRPY
jgi:hypothetical protein